MTTEQNKAVVREWVEKCNENDHVALGALYDDNDFSWRISRLSPVSHKYAKRDVVALMGKTFATPMKRRLNLKVKHITAEEDRVALEAERSVLYLDGSEFRNFYHLLFTLRDGKIIRGRAYLDTSTAANSSLAAHDRGRGLNGRPVSTPART